MAISPSKADSSFSELHLAVKRLQHQCEHWASGQDKLHNRVDHLLQELQGRYSLPQSSQFTVPQHDIGVPSQPSIPKLLSQPSIPKLAYEADWQPQGSKGSKQSTTGSRPPRKSLLQIEKESRDNKMRLPEMESREHKTRPSDSSESENYKVSREISSDLARELDAALHETGHLSPALHDACHDNLEKSQEHDIRNSECSSKSVMTRFHRHGAGTVEAQSTDVQTTKHWRAMMRQSNSKHRWSHLTNPIMDRTKAMQEKGLSCINRMVTSRYYEAFMFTLVIGNAGFLGWQVSYQAEQRTTAYEHEDIETAFCVVFVFELICRMMTERGVFFWGPDCNWNLFDCIVVGVMVVEQILSLLDTVAPSFLQSMSILRALRLVRLLRALRIIRVLSLFRELRMMVRSITSSLLSLVWVIMILGMMFFVFGIILTQAMIEYCNDIGWTNCDGSDLRKHFGTLPTTTLSLFEAMSGGISWGEIVDALSPLSPSYTYLFLLYISFSLFAVVNIVTGIFVETAIGSGHQDRDAVIQENMALKRQYVESIHEVFSELDLDQNGHVGLQEMESAIEDVNMVAYFHALGLEIHDVRTLFVLLDRDQTGVIDIEEFLIGCLRLKGEAKSLDVAKMHYEIEWVVHNLESLIVDVRTLLELNNIAS